MAEIARQRQPLPLSYALTAMAAAVLFNVIPFTEELIRGLARATHALSLKVQQINAIAVTNPRISGVIILFTAGWLSQSPCPRHHNCHNSPLSA